MLPQLGLVQQLCQEELCLAFEGGLGRAERARGCFDVVGAD
jgi:hypothetical protein